MSHPPPGAVLDLSGLAGALVHGIGEQLNPEHIATLVLERLDTDEIARKVAEKLAGQQDDRLVDVDEVRERLGGIAASTV